MRKIIIAIDGYSACGKSTLAKDLSKRLNYLHIDSGAMYRAATYFFIQNGINYNVPEEVIQGLHQMKISVDPADSSVIFLQDVDISSKIRTEQINAHVSEVSILSAVRKKLVHQQQIIGENKGVIMDGRDIGSVVFQDAELKIFLTASLEVRTQRRLKEYENKNMPISFEAVKANLVKRDEIDSTRKDSPLIQAHDAVILDNTNLTRKEQLEMALALARCRSDFQD